MVTPIALSRKYSLLLLLLTWCIPRVHAQQLSLRTALHQFASRETPEQVYLQYDKPSYQPGETIWFKVYLMAGGLPDTRTRSFYVDWADDNSQVISHDSYPVANAATHGQFDIPKDYRGKTLHIQAYTKWMLNFDTAFLYHKTIPVTPPVSRDTASVNDPGNTLFFFPEGGYLVAGLFNRVAFMAVNRYQQPVSVSGYISTHTGEQPDSFYSTHDGMGYFYLQPSPGTTYIAHWKDPDGRLHQTDVPAAQSSGVVLSLHPAPGKHILQLQRTDNDPRYQQLHLVATQQQQLIYEADVALDKENTTQLAIPVATLPSGILRYTIFDAGWQPLAERICFVNNGGYRFSPAINADMLSLEKRGLNILTLTIPDSLQADLSISITDDADKPDNNADNIFSGLLLRSELKGIIPHPAHYFKDNSAQTQEELDLVMLTHGWRRYNWENILQGKPAVFKYPRDTAYLSFSGQLSANKLPVLQKLLKDTSRKHLLLFSVRPVDDTLTQFLTAPIQENGYFSIPNLLIFDPLQVSYQFSDKRINFSTADIHFIPERIDSAVPFSRPIFPPPDPRVVLHPAGELNQPVSWRDAGNSIQLKTVDVTAREKSAVALAEEKYTSAKSIFRGMFGYGVDVQGDRNSAMARDIFTYLAMRIPGLRIEPGPDPLKGPLLIWTGQRSVDLGKGMPPPTLYYNESATNMEFVLSLSVAEIAYVKAFTPPFGSDKGGAIAIYTKNRNADYNPRAPNIRKEVIAGYAAIKEFYMPDYSIAVNDHIPDARTTLYWNPMLRSNTPGAPVTIRFYNNDYTKAYRVIIEGVAKNGQLARIEQVFHQ